MAVRDLSAPQPMLPSARTFHVKRSRLISEQTLAFSEIDARYRRNNAGDSESIDNN
jgi:hypothetical protein